ncbi:MAG: amidohydrolase [Gammaproteobacteria bacterium]
MPMSRRRFHAGAAALGLAAAVGRDPRGAEARPELILRNGRFSTLDPQRPEPAAVAVANGRFVAVGDEGEMMAQADAATRVLDLGGRRVVPGLIDSHLHLIRGGLSYNLELRWDGLRSLADAMALLKRQVAVTPPPQWVRVVGGFTEHQFAEQRLPTLDELNRIAPDTPVFILHLYDRALLNRAALRVVGYTKDTPDPPGGRIERDGGGNPTGLLLAKPNALILYATLARGPALPVEYQRNSTLHFMRELNRLGVTSVIDAGGGFQRYPEDYAVIRELHAAGELTVRIAYNLFTQKKGEELADFARWSAELEPHRGDALFRHNGAGEMLVFSAADFEDFREPAPALPAAMKPELEAVVRLLAERRWPWRLHATYDETISQALDAFEAVQREVPFTGLHWFFDHCETLGERNLERIAALGGGIAIQHRMMFQGEYFAARYGREALAHTPPLRRMLEAGVPLGAGTDATRVASYNPWVSFAWLVTGRTLGGLQMYPATNLLSREEALRLWTVGNTWFSSEVGRKGRIAVGEYADLAVLDRDVLEVAEDELMDTVSVLTLLGGRVVHGGGEFRALAPALPAAMPDWSPVRLAELPRRALPAHAHAHAPASCSVHGHRHAPLGTAPTRAADETAFWGAFGCSCWAV